MMIIAGKYEVTGELGRGGMGVVYQVRHRELGAVFALKTLRATLTEETEAVGRFYHEAWIIAQLRHPNIVKVFDVGRDGDRHYFVMEYVQGRSLREILDREGPLSLSRVLAISQQVGQALAYAHACQPCIVHRDIKPQNILIEDDTGRVVVMDFGIAKLLGTQQVQYTANGVFIGTLTYGAPEQIRSDLTVDGRADIFSLGLVMYEMITGHGLFSGLTQQEIIARQLHGSKNHVLNLPSQVPAALHKLVAKAVAKDQDRRFATAGELLDALAKVRESNTPRLRWPVLLFGGTVITGAGLLVAWVWLSGFPSLETMRQALATWRGSTQPAQPAMLGDVPGQATPLVPVRAVAPSKPVMSGPPAAAGVSPPMSPSAPESIRKLPESPPSPLLAPIASAPVRSVPSPDQLEIQHHLEKMLTSPSDPAPRLEPDSPFDPERELEQALRRKNRP